MNEEYRELIRTIQKASAVEAKMGYRNAAVFGGFDTFVLSALTRIRGNGSVMPPRVKSNLDRISGLMKSYRESGAADRQQSLKSLLEFIEQSLTAAPPREQPDEDKKSKSVPSLPELGLVKSVGPRRERLLNKLGIYSVEDLLYHFPRRYEDRAEVKKFYQLVDGETETIMGTVAGIQEVRPRKGLTITKAALHDGQSLGYAVWFNQPFVKKQIPQGTEVLVTGKVEKKFGVTQVAVADFEITDKDDTVHVGRIVPVYPATEGLQVRALRTIIKSAMDKYGIGLPEFLPETILKKYRFPRLFEALEKIHFPGSMEEVEQARQRLAFEELFLLQLGVNLLKSKEQGEKGIAHKKESQLLTEFLCNLPFGLTGAQKRVLEEIFRDMEMDRPMNRLVQGDVGSGKTVIAAAALVKAVAGGYQGAMMAPTEILAAQHYEGLRDLLQPFGVSVEILTGSLTRSERVQTLDNIINGVTDIVVGTHAIIQDEVEFRCLGLAVTDEQHRFGVRQRALLKQKGSNPDVLVMTATPIPRTLALTVYGDLDVSVIDELPPGRQAIKTHWVTAKMKDRVYRFVREQVKEGRQVYYICPLVEESEKLDVSAVVEHAETLRTKVFPDLQVGLLHGRLKQDDKDLVMKEFKDGNVNILVATTVVEVGVNVPNATLIIIEDADRFGLAQLHQLRGRVGRGSHRSYCVLMADPSTEEGRARMKIMQETTDGFVIAEEDLKLRGPGEFFGTRQSGMPDLKIADIIKDIKLLQLAREEAQALVKRDPGLRAPEHAGLRRKVSEKFRGNGSFIKIS